MSASGADVRAAVAIARLRSSDPGFAARLDALLAHAGDFDPEVESAVRGIIAEVRRRGDAALLEYTRRFDGLDAPDVAALRVPAARIAAALDGIGAAPRGALETAAARIRAFHERQRERSWSYREADGTRLGQRVTPLDSVGLYVPGGRAAYPSSVLMNAVPARVAGVGRLVMTVPAPGGRLNDLVLAAAAIAGVDEIVTIGGAQAVAALAYGTESVAPVDKIVGPGNAYVATAKRLVFGAAGIDLIAGPSEVLVVCDGETPPEWIAMDLFAQAEHDERARAWLLCPRGSYLDEVQAAIERLLPSMERAATIRAALEGHGALVEVRDLAEAMSIANRIAPEHLELSVADPGALVGEVRHAGAVFLGRYSAEALGDYCAGPNHVLPTGGTARFSSPLGVYDFQKRTSEIECSREGAAALARVAGEIARGEGLTAHARSAEYRGDGSTSGPDAPTTAGAAAPTAAALAVRLVREDVRALAAYRTHDASGLVKLDAMENPYPLPPVLENALLEALRGAAINRYPDPDARELKALLCEAMAVPDEAGLVLGNGSDELIQTVALAFARPGATLLAPDPGFSMYRQIALTVGMTYAPLPLGVPAFELDAGQAIAALERHRPEVVFIAYPNNPTGNLFARESVEAVIRHAPGVVVIDEAYAPFARASFMADLARFPNLLVLRTVSKLGLAGLRLGVLAGAPAWTGELEKLRLPYNVNVLTQRAAIFALRHRGVLEEQTDRVRAERARLHAALAALSGVRVWPSDANFLLFRCERIPAGDVFAGLRARGVLVRNLDGSSPALDGCLRVTVGRAGENRVFLTALEEVLGARKRSSA